MNATKGKETLLSHAHLVKEHNSASNKVKLCGYLKKKRNVSLARVGGWRKLWFVLQDKLLLSYSSKEEYDNKLVSFKDVLNLVPGTLVRPLGGFRFTIETTSQAMYTFHCDDRSAYREWIAKLLDSLATQPSVARIQKFSHRFCNYSVDNIPNALSIMTMSSTLTSEFNSNLTRDMTHSFDSISHAERIVGTVPQKPMLPLPPPPLIGGCVRLPIVHNTAKILERNGVNSVDLQVLLYNRKANSNSNCTRRYLNREDHSNNETQFRLHNNNNNNNMVPAARSSAIDLRTSSNSIYQPHQPPASAQSVLMINRLFSKSNIISNSDNDHFELFRSSPKTFNIEATRFKEKSSKRNCDRIYANSSSSDLNSETFTSCTQECKALGLVKDQIQRMSIRGSRESTFDADVDTECSKVTTTTSMEQVIIQPRKVSLLNGNIDSGMKTAMASTNQNNNLPLEPIYAVIDLKHKYAHRKMRNSNSELLDKRCNSYDSIIQNATTTPQQPTITTTSAQQQNVKLDNLSENDIDGIYEDGETFFNASCSSTASKIRRPFDEDDEDENIYEPINISSSHHHKPNTFWRYFTRLKVNSFLQFKRMRKRSSSDYDSIKLPVTTKLPQQSSTTLSSSSHFSSIKHKFGTHRKSMQLRMRRFCARAAYEPKPFFKHSAVAKTALSSGSTTTTSIVPTTSKTKSKYRWKSVKVRPKKHVNASSCGGANDETSESSEKRFFGSLPHLRKPRVSLFVASAAASIKNNLPFEGGDDKSSDDNNTNQTVETT